MTYESHNKLNVYVHCLVSDVLVRAALRSGSLDKNNIVLYNNVNLNDINYIILMINLVGTTSG